MGSCSDILRNWIPVGDHFYQRTELYGSTWSSAILENPSSSGGGSSSRPMWLEAAPFGGPVVTVWSNGRIRVHSASGREIAHFTWDHKLPFPVTVGWSHREEPVFVVDDGTVIVYDLHGQYLKSVSMGEEVKQTRVKEAKVFRSGNCDVTGVAVLTEAGRFFVVNNIHTENSRVRKFQDVNATSTTGLSWSVIAAPASSSGSQKSRTSASGARIVLAGVQQFENLTSDGGGSNYNSSQQSQASVCLLSEHGAIHKTVECRSMSSSAGTITSICVASDQEHVGLYFDSGVLWMGRVPRSSEMDNPRRGGSLLYLQEVSLASEEAEPGFGDEPDWKFTWCGTDGVICLSPSTNKMVIASVSDGSKCSEFVFGHLACVTESDGARILCDGSQEWLARVPKALHHTVALTWTAGGGKDSNPGNRLLKALEEKGRGSHRAIEYVRSLVEEDEALETAVSQCIESAGLIVDNPVHQKEMIRAAQFGKSFISASTQDGSARDDLKNACKYLRVINALRLYQVGVPLTLAQFHRLSPRVVIDRLLARRLFPLAQEISNWLELPPKQGVNRVLQHWARYKIQGSGSASEVAEAIRSKLHENKVASQIPYSDIAEKARSYGKVELAYHLLKYETSVNRQVPLLVTLDYSDSRSLALQKALDSGDRNLIHNVIWELRSKLPSDQYHMLLRKWSLGKILYQSYCKENQDLEALQEWHQQEDNFGAQAVSKFERAFAGTREPESRMRQLINVKETFDQAAKQQATAAQAAASSTASGAGSSPELPHNACAGMVDEAHKLLRSQQELEKKFPGKNFVGMPLHQTISDLLQSEDPAQAKQAEKIRSDFKMSDRRFQWLKLKKFAVNGQWDEIHKFCAKQVKGKKSPPITMESILALVKQHAPSSADGEAAAVRPLEEMIREDQVKRKTEFSFMS